MTKKEAQQAEAVRVLKEWGVKNNTTICAKVTHISSSGMSRRVRLYMSKDGDIIDITYWAAQALEWGYKDGWNKGINVTGCGMDMLFHTIDCLSYAMGYGPIAQTATNFKGLRYRSL